MLENIVTKWTTKIIENSRKGLHEKALSSFIHMLNNGIEPNAATFSATINVCAQSQSLNPNFGLSLHCLVLKKGFSNNLFVSTGLVSIYSKNYCMVQARHLFDEMSVRDSVSWNSMISSYTHKGFNKEAVTLFCDMINNGCDDDLKLYVNCFTLASILKACAGLGCSCSRLGESVHGYVVKLGCDSDYFVGSSIVYMYSSYGNLSTARQVFDRMINCDLVVWNTMITGYVQNSYEEEAIDLFYQLQYQGFVPNDTTYTCILKASSMMEDDLLGRSLHARTLKSGVLTDVFLGTAVVNMYSKFFEIQEAKRVFDEMKIRNLVSYNALMAGYSLIGEHEEGLKAYLALQIEGMKPDSFTFIALFTSCSVSNAISEGVQIHSHSLMCGLESDISVGNSIVNFYSKCGLVDCAMKAFESIHPPNTISWANIISGLAQNGENEKAIDQFNKMHKLSKKTDEFTSSSVLKAVASLASTEQGRHLHAHVIKTGLDGTVFVRTALINLYSKYGLIDDAHNAFCYTSDKNVVPWNSMITGYAQNGFCKEALVLFHEMTISEISPTSVSFTGVLFACSNAGLVEEGKNYYNLMTSTYKITPSVEHCTCMVDLLGRAGYLDEAANFILNSRFSNEPEIWGALLSACGVHKNVDLGSRVAQYCLRLVPHDSSIFTFLSNMYASKELWGKASTARDYMKEMGIEKEPGYSWIEVRNIENALVA